MTLLDKHTHNRIYDALFRLLAFVLPIHERLVTPVILLIGLNWLLELNFGEKLHRLKSHRINRLTLLFGIVYLPYVAGAFYSDNFEGWSGAWFALEVKLSLLVFPLLFSTIQPSGIHPQFFKRLVKAFIMGCIISGLLIINLAIFHYFIEGTSSVFFYSRLSDPFHPSYLSLYYSLAIAVLSYWLISRYAANQTKTVFVVMLILFFQVLTIFLSSKAGIIGVFLVYSMLLVFTLTRIRQQNYMPSILMTSLAAIYLLILLITPPALGRFVAVKQVMEEEQQGSVSAGTAESTASRVLIWKSSLEIIHENLLFGVGTGDVKTTLLEKYREKDIKLAYEKGLNAHNQFLQTFMATGMAGFLLLTLSLLIPAWFAFRKRKIIYLIFITLIIFHNLVEAMLERQAGVVFYGFFNALLFYFAWQDEDN